MILFFRCPRRDGEVGTPAPDVVFGWLAPLGGSVFSLWILGVCLNRDASSLKHLHL